MKKSRIRKIVLVLLLILVILFILIYAGLVAKFLSNYIIFKGYPL